MAQINHAESKFPIQSKRAGYQNPQALSQLANLAIVGQVILFASAWLLPLVSEYELAGDNMSELVLGQVERETILLIAGTGQQLVGWPIEFVNALVERGYRVIRFDNRDVGLSTKLSDTGVPDAAAVAKALQEGKTPAIPYTLRELARDTVGLLDALGIEQAHLVGASMGGAIGQWVAIDYPERVLSLTTIAADSGNPQLPVIADPEAFADVPPQPITADREAFIDWQVKTFQVLAGTTYPTDTAQKNSLKFEEVTSTLIACSDQAVSEQEQQYLEALQTASRFAIDGDTLT